MVSLKLLSIIGGSFHTKFRNCHVYYVHVGNSWLWTKISASFEIGFRNGRVHTRCWGVCVCVCRWSRGAPPEDHLKLILEIAMCIPHMGIHDFLQK